MEQKKQLFGGSVYDRLPPLSANHTWIVAQNLEVEDGTEEQIFYTVDGQIHYRCRVPELVGRRIRGYFHGSVILSNNVTWYLWNHVTCKVIHLPPLILEDGDIASIGQCCLSSPPYDHGSFLLLTRTTKPSFLICRLDGESNKLRWIEMSYGGMLKKITNDNDDDSLLYCPACFNGKIYALKTKGRRCVIQVDIVANHGETIQLFLLERTPRVPWNYSYGFNYYLTGSGTELFCIIVALVAHEKKTVGNVYLFKLKEEDSEEDGIEWEEIVGLKDAVFFVDLACDNSVFYSHAERGGYVYIRDEMGKMIYSYDVEDKTVYPSYMRFQASHFSLWECRLKSDHGEVKCPHDFKEEAYKDGKIMVKSVKDDDDDDDDDAGFHTTLDKSRLNSLPFDILELIMELCVGVEYMHFRATCKRCHLAAPLIQWSNNKARLKTYSVLSPWLMVVNSNRGTVTFTDPILGDKYFMKEPQHSIHHEIIFCSRFGWLLYYTSPLDINESLLLFNPFTNEIRNLPSDVGDVDEPHWTSRLPYLKHTCFSAPPTSPDCTIVGLTFIEPTIYLHRVAEEETWRMVCLDTYDVDSFSICFPTLHGKDLYVLCNKGELYVIKNLLVQEQEQTYFLDKVVDAGSRSGQDFLVKSDQHLLLVTVANFGESVDVFKLNEYRKKWEKIDCLGTKMIYICRSTCLCIEAKTPEMENKIYFPRLDSKNGNIVFYSLETRKYYSFNDKNIRESSWMGIEHCDPHVWIEPSWL